MFLFFSTPELLSEIAHLEGQFQAPEEPIALPSVSPVSPVETKRPSLWSSLKQFFSWMTSEAGDLGSVYSAKSNVEPKVFQVQGQSGELFWEIYDPTTGQTIYCSTDEEALQWFNGSRWM